MVTLQLAVANKHFKSPTTPTNTNTHSKSHRQPFDFPTTFLIPYRCQNPTSSLPKPSFIVAKPSLIIAKTQPHRCRSTSLATVRSLQFATVQVAGRSRRFSSPTICNASVLRRPFAMLQSFADHSRRFSPSSTVRDNSILRTIYDASSDTSILLATLQSIHRYFFICR